MRALNVFKNRQESLNYHPFQSHDDEGHKVVVDQVENVLLDIGMATMHRAKKMSRKAPTRVSRRVSRRAPTISNAADKLSNSEITCDRRESHLKASNIIETTHPPTHQPLPQASSNEYLGLMTDEHSDIHSRNLTRHYSLPTPDLSESSPSRIASSSVLDQNSSLPDGPVLLDEGDYIGVQASDYVLHLDPDLNYEVTGGYINSDTKPTNAILNSQFPQNIISELYAAELGLAIQYFQENDEDNACDGAVNKDIARYINFGNGDLHSVIGRTTFWWRKDQQVSHLRPLKVTCLVSGSSPLKTPLVFGQRYINRRMHYWRR